MSQRRMRCQETKREHVNADSVSVRIYTYIIIAVLMMYILALQSEKKNLALNSCSGTYSVTLDRLFNPSVIFFRCKLR